MEHPDKLLRRLGISPLKSFGQNFLLHTNSLEGSQKELDSSKITLEIGPGLGAVTEFFLGHGFRMVLCEKDRTLAAYLREKFPPALGNSPEVLEGDFLKQPIDVWQEKSIAQVVGNLPFYITAPIIVRTVYDMFFVRSFFFGIQKDVAEKITQPYGNSLALFLQAAGDLRIFSLMKKGNFYPVPQVDAAWVLWKRNPKVENLKDFELLLRGSFWGKRKSLYNSLKKNPFFKGNDVFLHNVSRAELFSRRDLFEKRPDQITFQEYLLLYSFLTEK